MATRLPKAISFRWVALSPTPCPRPMGSGNDAPTRRPGCWHDHQRPAVVDTSARVVRAPMPGRPRAATIASRRVAPRRRRRPEAGEGATVSTSSVHRYEDPQGTNWLVFAGVLLMMSGLLDAIYGIAAVTTSVFFDPKPEF